MGDKCVIRDWGEWEVLAEGEGYKIKRLVIAPNQSISLQYHKHRCEVWYIIQGEGLVELAHKNRYLEVGDMVFIGVGEKHRVTNTSSYVNLIAVEAQLGAQTEEEDIVRL
jgi:mannose-6-phosphate isomerase-like protein (cupin superfamily)